MIGCCNKCPLVAKTVFCDGCPYWLQTSYHHFLLLGPYIASQKKVRTSLPVSKASNNMRPRTRLRRWFIRLFCIETHIIKAHSYTVSHPLLSSWLPFSNSLKCPIQTYHKKHLRLLVRQQAQCHQTSTRQRPKQLLGQQLDQLIGQIMFGRVIWMTQRRYYGRVDTVHQLGGIETPQQKMKIVVALGRPGPAHSVNRPGLPEVITFRRT